LVILLNNRIIRLGYHKNPYKMTFKASGKAACIFRQGKPYPCMKHSQEGTNARIKTMWQKYFVKRRCKKTDWQKEINTKAKI
jgi:hypothetical protein